MTTGRWNFCPYCGHRLYQHDAKGCTHVEIEESYEKILHVSRKPENRRVTKNIPCDCKHPHPLIAEAGV